MNDKQSTAISKEETTYMVPLDFGEAFVKIDDHGNVLNPFRAKITLSEKKGHIYKINQNHAITSDGYIQLNKVASVNIVTPQSIIMDGEVKPNPFIERNKNTRIIETVNVRKIGVGFSPVGNITVIDKSLYYNIYTYFIQSIQAKMKKKVWKNGKPTDEPLYKDMAITGTKGDPPEKGKWAFFETAFPLGIWVNYEHPAILDCLDEHTQRQKFGDRIAQKIVERNILKDHPAIGAKQVEVTGGKATVIVHGWRHSLKTDDINDIKGQAERGSEDLSIDKSEVVDVEVDEEKQAIEEVKETEDQGNPATDKEPPPGYVNKQGKDGEK